MRIKQADVADLIEETILSIREGMQAAQAQGIVFDGMPKALNFSLDIVQIEQDNVQVTEQDGNQSEDATTDTAADVASANEVTTESAVTDTETVERTATQDTTEGGSDVETTVNDWDSFET